MSKINIQKVADMAGVSKSTVSRVIHGDSRISEKTKIKVQEVISELNYRPNAIARSLAKGTSKNIGLIMPSDENFFENPFFLSSLKAITKHANLNNYDVLLVYNQKNELEPIEKLIQEYKVDGFIVLRAVENDKTIKFLRNKKIPFVLIGRSVEYNDVYLVDTDNIKATFDITEELILRDKKNIAFISGNQNSVVTLDRFAGYKKALEKYEIELDKNIIDRNEFKQIGGYKSIEKIMKLSPDIDGIVVTDAMMFLGVVEYILKNKKIFKNEIAIGTFISSKKFKDSDNFLLKSDNKLKIVYVDVMDENLGQSSCKKLVSLLQKEKNIKFIDLINYKIKKTYRK